MVMFESKENRHIDIIVPCLGNTNSFHPVHVCIFLRHSTTRYITYIVSRRRVSFNLVSHVFACAQSQRNLYTYCRNRPHAHLQTGLHFPVSALPKERAPFALRPNPRSSFEDVGSS